MLSLCRLFCLIYPVVEAMPVNPLNNYLRMHRRRTALSQGDIACLLGVVSGTKLSRYESGQRAPNLETALALEIIFGIPVRELFAGMFHEVEQRVRERAAPLIEELRARGPSRETTRKLQALISILTPAT